MMITPALLISLTPLIRLKEHFEASMSAVGASRSAQDKFLESFEDKFNAKASYFNLNDWYTFNVQLNHWLVCDQYDQTSPYVYLKEFLNAHQFIKSRNYDCVGHEKVLKSTQVINDLINVVKEALNY